MKTIISTGIALAAAALLSAPTLAASNAFSDQLKKLPPIQQRSVMRRAVLDDKQYCKQVATTAYQGSFKNLEMWTARCDHGADYGIFIGPDGSVQVRPCRDLAELKLPLCKLPK